MRKLLFIMTVFFYSFVLASCKNICMEEIFSNKETINLALPKWAAEDSSENYPELDKWLIKVESENYSCQLLYDCKNNVTVDNVSVKDNIVSFDAIKNVPVSITAQPLTKTGESNSSAFFHPAGFIYPYNYTSGNKVYSLSWNEGFLAELMQNIFRFSPGSQNNSQGDKLMSKKDINSFIQSFNWAKASEYINNKINDTENPYNPWLLNKSRLLEKICTKKMSSTYLNLYSSEYTELPVYTDALPNPLSPFIPENKNIKDKKKILVSKKTPYIIYLNENTGALYKYFGTKNMSIEYILLPIYIEGI